MFEKIVPIIAALSVTTVSLCSEIPLNPLEITYGEYRAQKKADSNATCQFPYQLQKMLEGSLGEGKYRGGLFLTHSKKDDKPVLVILKASFFEELKPVLQRTKLPLIEGDITGTPLNKKIMTPVVLASSTPNHHAALVIEKTFQKIRLCP